MEKIKVYEIEKPVKIDSDDGKNIFDLFAEKHLDRLVDSLGFTQNLCGTDARQTRMALKKTVQDIHNFRPF